MIGILGTKIGMTRIQKEEGKMVPVTVVLCEENVITQLKTKEKNGYTAVVVGAGKTRKGTKNKPFRHLREFHIDEKELENYKKGDQVTLEKLQETKTITLIGTSKGKGTQGTIKRHHFSSGPGSHGSHFHREPGSVGMRAKPGRILRGKRMAGRMGNERVTTKNVEIVHLDTEKNLIALKGSIPGAKGSLVIIETEKNNQK